MSNGLESHYASLEELWDVDAQPDYGALVTPNGNSSSAVHRWFHMKEAFSAFLLDRVIRDTGLTSTHDLAVIDPFCGSGTSLVSLAAYQRSRNTGSVRFVGVESHPFLALLARTKLRVLVEAPPDPTAIGRVIAADRSARVGPSGSTSASLLSTFKNPLYFPPSSLVELMALREAVLFHAPADSDSVEADVARMSLGASVEATSRLRRDGRALRFQPQKSVALPRHEYSRRLDLVAEDTPASRVRLQGEVISADVRCPGVLPSEATSFDLALFSPPYPNNIDYTEVYKLELWILGYVKDQQSFATQRHRTLRSHPSLKFDDARHADGPLTTQERDDLLGPVLAAVPRSDRYTLPRSRLVRGYFEDMWCVFVETQRRLRPGGHLVFVVGNSAHAEGSNRFVIAADLLLARLAELAGFQVNSIRVARRPRRRRNESPYLRESVVFAQKPLRPDVTSSEA